MHALNAAANNLGIERPAVKRQHRDGGDMRRDIHANDDRKSVIEPDDLNQQRRAAEQFDVAEQKPIDHGPAPQAKDADDQTEQRSEKDRADRVGDGPAEPEPE